MSTVSKFLSVQPQQQSFSFFFSPSLKRGPLRKSVKRFQLPPNRKGLSGWTFLVVVLSPVNHKGCYQGWKQTSVYISLSLSLSQTTTLLNICPPENNTLHSIFHREYNSLSRKVEIIVTVSKCQPRSTVTHVLRPNHISRALSTRTCTNCLWRHAGWPTLFCRPTKKPVLATANAGKTRKRFWKKMQVNRPGGWKLARKKSLAVSVACMAI